MRETRPRKNIPVARIYTTSDATRHVRVAYDGAGNYTAQVVDAILFAYEPVYSREPYTRHARAAAKSAGLKLNRPGLAWIIWLDKQETQP